MLECSRVSKKTGRIISGTYLVNPELAIFTIKEVQDDGYLVEVQHNNGFDENIWIDGDLPKGVYFHEKESPSR